MFRFFPNLEEISIKILKERERHSPSPPRFLRANLRAALFLERLQNLIHCGNDLVVRERPVGRAERDRIRDGLPARAELVAAIDVEQLSSSRFFAICE